MRYLNGTPKKELHLKIGEYYYSWEKKLKILFKSHDIFFMSKLSDVLLNVLYESLNVNEHYDIDLDKYIIYS